MPKWAEGWLEPLPLEAMRPLDEPEGWLEPLPLKAMRPLDEPVHLPLGNAEEWLEEPERSLRGEAEEFPGPEEGLCHGLDVQEQLVGPVWAVTVRNV